MMVRNPFTSINLQKNAIYAIQLLSLTTNKHLRLIFRRYIVHSYGHLRMPNKHEKVLKKFGEQIRLLRTESGLSQEKLAELCGMDRTYISGIERGIRNVSLIDKGTGPL